LNNGDVINNNNIIDEIVEVMVAAIEDANEAGVEVTADHVEDDNLRV